VEASLGQAFGTEPKALSVVEQELNRGAGAIAEDIDGTAEGIIAQHLSAHGHEPIYALAKIDGLGGKKDAALRGELEHQGVSKNVRTNAASDGCGSW